MDERQKKSISRLSSPEQLDQLLTVIHFPGWIALLSLIGLSSVIVIWLFVGRIDVTASAFGIFFNPDAITLIQSEYKGVIMEIPVHQASFVKKGDVLLIIKDREKLFELKKLENKLSLLQKVESTHSNAEYNKDRIQIIELEEQIALLKEEIANLTVKAPENGRVLLIEVVQGEDVEFGKNMIWFEKTSGIDTETKMYAFFPLEKKDPIKRQMKALIKFNNINSDLYGKMLGVVKEIYPFAATLQGGILDKIPSSEMRKFLTQNAASVVVIIDPVKDPQTASGFAWTNHKGPQKPPSFGSVGDVEIVIQDKHPINYLIP